MSDEEHLRVYANPYAHLDHKGRPASAFPREPSPNNDDVAIFYIGATRVTTETHKANPKTGAEARHDYAWEFSPEPQIVADTDYYRRAIKQGDLLAADLETWRAAGCDPAAFVDPKRRLFDGKHGAIIRHHANHGKKPQATVDHWNDFHAPHAAARAAESATHAKQADAQPSAPDHHEPPPADAHDASPQPAAHKE